MADKKELKQIPGFSRGVQDGAAVRMLKMARPVCPNSQIPMERTADGRSWVPKDMGPTYVNCQAAKGEWWVQCEAAGHKPYERTVKWTTKEPIVEEDDKGRLVQTGEQLFYHEHVVPNIVQVAISIRINSGRGAQKAIEKKGYKRLKDIGYYEVCQFRNCQNPVSSSAKSKKYGNYCSVNHLQLICADAESVLLHYPSQILNGTDHSNVKREREKQLREAAVGAFDGS